ncbi:PQQ-binding-like beta-propeller repeat protein [Novipirellula artificiosorum]|uniref:Outer membrane biogenesis protein BamB n=1 Tax=Novipirellula artificiosorum TaxID=2528016 RepID=A0A5C6DWF8_9BACT|nr:PQQ-binding-like beta-propeller repeat protein [Novipirellula artificiosorum]TWU41733.1 outer membrane biogenesis protein BamB [Novipirellula artificiosorum]
MIKPIRNLALLLTICFAFATARADWPSWRGPFGHGSTDGGNYPTRLDDGTLLWQADLPGKGCSTPIVLDQTIFVTAPVDGQDAVLAFDWSGTRLWATTFGNEILGKHRNGSGCNASPVTDGSGVFAYFKSGTLAAVNLDGSVRWETNLTERFGEDNRFWDHGSSPVLTNKHVIMARMHAGDSWVAAFDKENGELAWKVDRTYKTPREADQCYTTPLVIDYQGNEAILVWGAQHLTLHDADDGKVVWSCGGFNPDQHELWPAIATPVILEEMIVICYGRNDRREPRMFGVALSGQGDVSETNHVWQRDDISAFVPSPAAHQGLVYIVRDRGEIECIAPATGKSIWSDAFPKHRTSYYASPVIVGDYLYAPREDGVVMVASIANNQFELLSENALNEPVIGSPVPVDHRILIRGENHLYCFVTK